MSFIQETKELKNYFVSWFLTFLVIAFSLFLIGLGRAEILGYHLYLPVFSKHSFSVMFFEHAKNYLIPINVQLIATSPSSAFIAQTVISFLGSMMITFPFLLYKFFQYLSPALYKREKRAVLKILFPSMILFLGGAYFAYIYLIPPTLSVLYSFNENLAVMPFFIINEFISWTLSIMFATGLMFLLPVFMYILSYLKIIPKGFWFKNWRIALAVFLILSAIVTPDGSGVTMALLAAPMMSLYIIGGFLGDRSSK